MSHPPPAKGAPIVVAPFLLAVPLLVVATLGCRDDAFGEEESSRSGTVSPAEGAPAEGAREGSAHQPERRTVRVLAEYPHDPAAYTQGLLWHEGRLYEGTGQYGESTLRRVRHEDGTVVQQVALPKDHFGEGIAVVADRIIQLTWHAGIAYVRDLETLEAVERRRYAGQGWGLTFDGSHLIMSDGTHVLTRRDPETLEVIDRIRVKIGANPLDNLNELEYAEGRIWANVYQTDRIVAIDPETGRVEIEIDASGLLDASARGKADVLNGIAYRPETATFFVTGKDWPTLFEVVFESEAAEGGR